MKPRIVEQDYEYLSVGNNNEKKKNDNNHDKTDWYFYIEIILR